MYKYLTSNKGFTLMEILIVVVVLGILTGVGVPIFTASFKKQKINECERNCQMLSTTIQQMMQGQYDDGKLQQYYCGKTFYDKSSADYMSTYSAYSNYDILPIAQFEDKRGFYKDNAVTANKPYEKEMVINCAFGNFLTSGKTKDGKEITPTIDTAKFNKYANVLNTDTSASNKLCQRLYYVYIYKDGQNTGRWSDQKVDDVKVEKLVQTIYGKRTNQIQYIFTFLLSNNKDQCLTLGILRGLHRSESSDEVIRDSTYYEGCKYGYYLKKSGLSDTPIYEFLEDGTLPVCPFDKDENPYYCVFLDGTVMCMCAECLAAKANNKNVVATHYDN